MSALQLLNTYKLYPEFTDEETEAPRCNDLIESIFTSRSLSGEPLMHTNNRSFIHSFIHSFTQQSSVIGNLPRWDTSHGDTVT